MRTHSRPNSDAKGNEFRRKCSQLREREGLTPPQLAQRHECSPTVIYNAEGRKDKDGKWHGISGATLRTIYHPLCKSKKEWLELLAMWAIDKTGIEGSLTEMVDTINSTGKKIERSESKYRKQLIEAASELSIPDQKILLRFATDLNENPPIKGMVEAFWQGTKN